MSQRYAPEVHAFIFENVAGYSAEELAQMTNAAFGTDFTKSSMKSYKANHNLKSGTKSGIKKGKPSKVFPAHIVSFISEHYKGTGPKQMAQSLNDTFGTSYTMQQLSAYYKNHHLNSGLTGRYEKGHVSHNKGCKGYYAPGSEKGWFRKGERPWDTVPVGTVVVKSDGYLWKKVGDKPGVWTQNWRQLHLLLWEEAHGAVPEGHRVIFKDGDRQNCVLENLALISLAENAVMNRHGLRFDKAEHTETGILIAKIKIASLRRKKGRKL